jgi:nucleoside-diphosphate-sugar epimerase
MLQYFVSRRVQIYLNFIMNLVDVRDVAAGLLLAMERGQTGQRYILGGENISLKKLLAIVGVISGRRAVRIPIPTVRAFASRRGRKPCRLKKPGASLVTHRVQLQRLWKTRYNRA